MKRLIAWSLCLCIVMSFFTFSVSAADEISTFGITMNGFETGAKESDVTFTLSDDRLEFEKISSMTVQQIIDYIDIVEQQIGVGNFDNDNWSVSSEQYRQIIYGINGTVGDEDKLQGKTRADVPENRQALLRFLEEKGWLKEQFKI